MSHSFSQLVREERLFCKECSAVTMHQLYSRAPLLSFEEVDPSLHLMATCANCNADQVVFAGDFRTFVRENLETRGCKIPGRSRINPGDRIYVTKQPFPAQVVSRFRQGEQIHLNVIFRDGQTGSLDFLQKEPIREESSRTYKLLPAQVEDALVGDWVFHVEHNVVGQVVGISHTGKEQIVIRLEGGNYILLRKSTRVGKIEDNRTLLERVQRALRQEFPEELTTIDLSVTNGIVYFNGVLTSLLERHRAIRSIEQAEGVLAVVARIIVNPISDVSDEELIEEIYSILANDPLFHLRSARVSVNRRSAEIYGDFKSEEQRREIYEELIKIEGLADLRLVQRKKGGFFN